eukprot:5097665-Prymnesium_polylepis.1
MSAAASASASPAFRSPLAAPTASQRPAARPLSCETDLLLPRTAYSACAQKSNHGEPHAAAAAPRVRSFGTGCYLKGADDAR